VLRSHGGAVPVNPAERETPHWWREVAHEVEKATIAREALRRVQEGDRILLDAGTTAWHMAKRFQDMPVTVITNSTQVAAALARHRQVSVLLLGGRFVAESLACVGPTAERQLREYRVNKLFFSCEAVDLDNCCLWDTTEAQAHLRREMLAAAEERYLLADHSKFGLHALARIDGLRAIDELITDSGTDETVLRRLTEIGLKATVAATGKAR
jgi:DeoR/GlpR family transcriptional regulator of sugar metabolism